MKKINIIAASVIIVAMCIFISIGYAAVSDTLSISGSAQATPPPLPDVYITNISPSSSAGVTIKGTSGTTMIASVPRGTGFQTKL